MKRFAIAALLITINVALMACTPGARMQALNTGIEVAKCVAANQDLPLEKLLVVCAAESVSPQDIERLFEAQKAATARAAARKAGCGKEEGK